MLQRICICQPDPELQIQEEEKKTIDFAWKDCKLLHAIGEWLFIRPWCWICVCFLLRQTKALLFYNFLCSWFKCSFTHSPPFVLSFFFLNSIAHNFNSRCPRAVLLLFTAPDVVLCADIGLFIWFWLWLAAGFYYKEPLTVCLPSRIHPQANGFLRRPTQRVPASVF